MQDKSKIIGQQKAELEILLFERPEDWAVWLDKNHAMSAGLWIRFAKKAAQLHSMSYAQALELALCYGWIDSQKNTHDSESWIQKFTPRSAKSIWSKINRESATELIQSGKMQPAGLKEVERAKEDGRWDSAYDSVSDAKVPSDLQVELDSNQAASDFFSTLNSKNRYAILFRIQTAKKAETRAKRIHQFISMLEKQEKIYP